MDEYLYAEYDVLPVPFVQGLAVGFILTMLLVGLWYGIPAVWWWLQDRLPSCPGCGERCDICDERMCAEDGPEPAITCDAHRLCVGCDDAANTCTGCAEARSLAHAEASA